MSLAVAVIILIFDDDEKMRGTYRIGYPSTKTLTKHVKKEKCCS